MMTKQEARKYFGLGDNDRIDRDGILRLQKNAEEQLRVWSLTQFHREKLEKEIEALDKEFNPNFHQAVFTAKVDGKDANIVLEVLQKGYMYKDKVIRPSMVKVSE